MKKILLQCLVLLFSAINVIAYDVVPLAGDNYSYLFHIYHKGENSGIEGEDGDMIGVFDILDDYRLPLFTSGRKWASVIDSGATDAVSYSVISANDYNAGAKSMYTTVAEKPYQVTFVNAKINGLTPTGKNEIPTDGFILIGLGIDPDHPGWGPFTGYHALNHSVLSDLNAVMLHEFMHSLGISSAVAQYNEEAGDTTYYFSEKGKPLSVFDKDLRIYEGSYTAPFDPTLEVVPQPEMAVGEGEDFDVTAYAPYYVGENTIKVLAGNDDYDTARDAIISQGGFINYSSSYDRNSRPNVYGLPIHPTDNGEDDEVEIELSHLELRNSYMSHQAYRNWLVPMEAELAVLKDVGYDIDLRESFGKSYYLNGVTDTYTRGFSEWNGSSYTGTPSDMVQAVGVHIYGNNNTITQASDILTAGEGSFGVRVEGTDNDYTLQSGQIIQSNGKENIGLGVTWGQNHHITVESGSAITAAADDGIAVGFDFGVNLFGIYNDVKGSYIYYDSSLDDNIRPDDETVDALVSNFDVAGTLAGGKAAIYISDNAHVENINLLDGALINGDIISEWNSVSSVGDAKVERFDGVFWKPVDPTDPSQIYFTQLNVGAGDTVTVNGSINGGNEIYNTLQFHNVGNVNVSGDTINVNSLENTGILTLAKAVLNTQTGQINGNGTLVVNQQLHLTEDMDTVENTVSLSSGALFSTLNDKAQDTITINTLKSDNGKISFDLGDSFNLQNHDAADTASLNQIKVGEGELGMLDHTSYILFEDNTLDLGTSSASFYYDGKRYTFAQKPTDARLLSISVSSGGAELGNAAADASTANYIVTNGVLMQDAGTVQGDVFEISGNDIDVNGHKGLVIDGANNPLGTTLLTGISGAADSNLTAQNNGELEVSALNKNIVLGQAGETALTLSTAQVTLDSADKFIIVSGDIRGTNTATDIVNMSGTSVLFNKVQDATVRLGAKTMYMNNRADNTAFELNSGMVHVVKDEYLAASGNNQLVVNGESVMQLSNGQASDIALAKMTLHDDLHTTIDVDLKTMSADRFVFQDSDDLDTQSHLLYLTNLQLLNSQVILEKDSYIIPVVSKEYHNENFLGGVKMDNFSYTLESPIFRYALSFEQNNNYAGLLLAHGPSDDYESYNPTVLTSPIAAQLGGYLGQLNMNEQAFARMETYRPENDSSAQEKASNGKQLSAALHDKDHVSLWASPYVSFGKVPLKKGPTVSNRFYGTAVGLDSPLYDIGRDWNGVAGFYVAYNGSYQRFEGISMNQNGGGLGVSGMAYKDNLFAGISLGGTMSGVRAKVGYGHENSSVLSAGLSTKAGYTWELGSRGQWLLQPELLAAYTWVYTPSYTNGNGVRITMDPLQALTLQPQLSFAGRFKNWGQPYAQVAWVGNFLDKTEFKANSVELPQFSVKPFMKYGLGIREMWTEKWSGYLETYFTSGGVRNVGVQAGLSYAL